MITSEELQKIPLIDTHVHRVHPNRTPEFGNLGGGYVEGPDQPYHSRQTILYHMIMEELKKEYGMMETVSDQEVEAERHRRYEKDPQSYLKNLIADQNVAMYCLEIGSPLGGALYSPEEEAYFNASIPKEKRRHIVRIERVQEALMKEELDFTAFMKKFRELLCTQIEKEQAVAIKSCAAYVGGLEVEIVSSFDAEQAYEKIRRSEAGLSEEKKLNNYLLLESTDIAAEYDIPIQIHTGAGGGGYLEFRTSNPMYLGEFLRHKKVLNRTKIVLLHGGHPHEEDTSYLTAQFSNVYTDFSGTFYLSTVKGIERMAALLERAPLNKIMYGSDGVMFPEFYWFSHRHFRRQLEKLLNGLIQEGYLTEGKARETAKRFMYENALQCYSKLNIF